MPSQRCVAETVGRSLRPIDFNRYSGLDPEIQRLFIDWLHRDDPNPFERFIFTWIAFNGWAERVVVPPHRETDWVAALAGSQEIRDDFEFVRRTRPRFDDLVAGFADWWPIFKAQDQRKQAEGRGGGQPPQGPQLRWTGCGQESLRLTPGQSAARRSQVTYWLGKEVGHAPNCQHPGGFPEDWPHLLSALYRVRNNLFHGEKSMRLDADRALVRVSGNLLHEFLISTGYLSGTTPGRVEQDFEEDD